jgi:hypothetical protein
MTGGKVPLTMDPDQEDPLLPMPRDAVYTNYLQAACTAREVILEFGQYHSGEAAPRIHTRLVAHPAYLEEFLKVMVETLSQYKAKAAMDQPGTKPLQ